MKERQVDYEENCAKRVKIEGERNVKLGGNDNQCSCRKGERCGRDSKTNGKVIFRVLFLALDKAPCLAGITN